MKRITNTDVADNIGGNHSLRRLSALSTSVHSERRRKKWQVITIVQWHMLKGQQAILKRHVESTIVHYSSWSRGRKKLNLG
nr:hypothetical protein [Tanacetum cinerariifolium]